MNRFRGAILEHIRAGHSLYSLSKLQDMPGATSLYRWCRRDPDFARAVHQACQDRQDLFMDRILELAEQANPANLEAIRRQMAPLNRRLGRLTRRPGAKWMT